MRNIEILIHPTCSSSYILVKELVSRNLINKIRVVIADKPWYYAVYNAWSVPWIVVNNQPAASDPINADEVEKIILEGEVERKDPVEAFKEAILHSMYASSLVALWESLDPVIHSAFISAATRAPLINLDVVEATRIIMSNKEKIYHEVKDMVYRVLGVGFTRTVWWATKGLIREDELASLAHPQNIKTWLLATASIGRIGLPGKPWEKGDNAAEQIASFIRRSARGLINKIQSEQERIINDSEYWRVLEEIKRRSSGAAGI